MRTCRQSQPLPAAARPPAQKQRAPHQRSIARNRPPNRLPASAPPLRPARALPKPRQRGRAHRPRAGKQGQRQPLTRVRVRLLHPRQARLKSWRRAAKRLLNNQPAARKRRRPHRAPPPRRHHDPQGATRPSSQRAGPPRQVQPRRAARLLLKQPGPRRSHPRNAQVSRNAAGQQPPQGSDLSRAATASAPAHALHTGEHRRTLERGARPHLRRDRQNGASTR